MLVAEGLALGCDIVFQVIGTLSVPVGPGCVGVASNTSPLEIHLVLKVVMGLQVVTCFPRRVFRGLTHPLNQDQFGGWMG